MFGPAPGARQPALRALFLSSATAEFECPPRLLGCEVAPSGPDGVVELEHQSQRRKGAGANPHYALWDLGWRCNGRG
jgi:hypothetical protein